MWVRRRERSEQTKHASVALIVPVFSVSGCGGFGGGYGQWAGGVVEGMNGICKYRLNCAYFLVHQGAKSEVQGGAGIKKEVG